MADSEKEPVDPADSGYKHFVNTPLASGSRLQALKERSKKRRELLAQQVCTAMIIDVNQCQNALWAIIDADGYQ